MEDINYRLLMLERMVRQMANERERMQGQINSLSETVDVLKQYINDLEQKVKANETK
ncbi:hypothetical protein PDN66_25210 [Bacillus cereus]|uniref:hypothetical protein n=1 Tax=Bacillus cereus TaxID=1396 RepID=UPI003D65DD54|nr:hypothetical protein [Bacillus cereus]